MVKKGQKLPRGFLTEKAAAFVENMAKPGMPAKRAAKLAGYDRPSEAQRLLENEYIHKRILERKTLAAELCDITPEQIIGATALRAFATIDDAFDDDGNFDIKKARKTGAIHLVKKLEKTQTGYKVEFYDNASAQEKLGNYLGLDKAPADNNDVQSLKKAIDEVALALAEGGPVTSELKKQAWEEILKWATEKRARYSRQAIDIVAREINELDS